MSRPQLTPLARPSLVKTIALATVAGVVLGAVELWTFGFSGPSLLRACAAGVIFMWVVALWGHFLGQSKVRFVLALWMVAGAFAGFAWWAVAPNHMHPVVPCVVGAGLAALWDLVESGLRHADT